MMKTTLLLLTTLLVLSSASRFQVSSSVTASLPSRFLSSSDNKTEIIIQSGTFSGTYGSPWDFQGVAYAQYDAFFWNYTSGSFNAFYNQTVAVRVYDIYHYTIYVNKSLPVDKSVLLQLLDRYYRETANATIIQAIANSSSNTTNATVYIPNYYNSTPQAINCQNSPWYCSNASSQSQILFQQVYSSNLSITFDSQYGGYLNGVLTVPYTATFINSSNSSGGSETIVSSIQGYANLSIWGTANGTGGVNGTYNVTVSPYTYASATYDRSYFIVNAAQKVFSDIYSWQLQTYLSNYFQNSSNSSLVNEGRSRISGKSVIPLIQRRFKNIIEY